MITDTIGVSDYYSPNNGHSLKGQYHGMVILDGLFYKYNLDLVRCYLSYSMFISLVLL